MSLETGLEFLRHFEEDAKVLLAGREPLIAVLEKEVGRSYSILNRKALKDTLRLVKGSTLSLKNDLEQLGKGRREFNE